MSDQPTDAPAPAPDREAIADTLRQAQACYLDREWDRAATLFRDVAPFRQLTDAEQHRMWVAIAFAALHRQDAAAGVDAYLTSAWHHPALIGNSLHLFYDSLIAAGVPRPELSRLLSGLAEIAPDAKGLDRLDSRNRKLSRADSAPDFLAELTARGILIAPHQQANTAVMIFGGVRGHHRMPFLNADLRAVPAHLIFLYDRSNLVFARGIQPIADSYAGTLEGLRAELRALKVRRLVTVGLSAGGFPAVRYGLDLDASASLVFSAITSFEQSDYEGDGRGLSTYRRIRAVAGEEMVDLRPLLEAQKPPFQLVAVFGAAMERDRMQARRLRGVPGVALVGIPGCTEHDSASVALKSGLFQSLLAALVDGCGAAESRRRAAGEHPATSDVDEPAPQR